MSGIAKKPPEIRGAWLFKEILPYTKIQEMYGIPDKVVFGKRFPVQGLPTKPCKDQHISSRSSEIHVP